MIRKRKQQQPRREFITANHRIRYPELRVLDDQGGMLGVMTTREAQQKAAELEKDLVLVTEQAKPPIAKIIDLAKYKYQLKQKKSESRKKAKQQEIKEIRFSPFMGQADFDSRLKKVINFLTKGDKVKLTLRFKGRAITKKEFGYDQFTKVVEATQEIGTVEIEPKMVGKQLIAQLSPIKKIKQ